MSKVVVTGGCGFVGHHFVEHVLKNTDWEVIVVDKLSYSSFGYDRLRDIGVFDDRRVHTVNHDFSLPASHGVVDECRGADYFVHIAAESHVDNSIADPVPFIMSNVLGTHYALMMAKELGCEKIVYFSTDEVFGPAPFGVDYKEWDRYKSSNPYAASKAGGEELAVAYHNTYGIPVMITHTMNIFGERQHPEKFIPLVIKKVLDDDVVTIHSDPTRTQAATRYWLHARNAADAVLFLLENGEPGDKYNIFGEREIDVLELAKIIANQLGRSLRYDMVDFHSSRPGHDTRYALDGSKLAGMGYAFPKPMEESLRKTVDWMVAKENIKWL
jgi:dTDP-glucose 4,6-dehydratase